MRMSEKTKWLISGIWGTMMIVSYLLVILWPAKAISGFAVICAKIIIAYLLFVVLFGKRLEKGFTTSSQEGPKILFYDNHFARSCKDFLDEITNGSKEEKSNNGANRTNKHDKSDGIHDSPPGG